MKLVERGLRAAKELRRVGAALTRVGEGVGGVAGEELMEEGEEREKEGEVRGWRGRRDGRGWKDSTGRRQCLLA